MSANDPKRTWTLVFRIMWSVKAEDAARHPFCSANSASPATFWCVSAGRCTQPRLPQPLIGEYQCHMSSRASNIIDATMADPTIAMIMVALIS